MQELEKYRDDLMEIIQSNCLLSKEQDQLQNDLDEIKRRLKEILLIKDLLEDKENTLINKIERETGKKLNATEIFQFLTNQHAA
jgi:predicted nuclease with TOPRIM domain